jgi:hypothetical protein
VLALESSLAVAWDYQWELPPERGFALLSEVELDLVSALALQCSLAVGRE